MHEPRRFYKFIIGNPLPILALVAVLTIILSAGIPRLKMRPFLEGDLPSSDPTIAANKEYSEIFGEDDFAYLAIVSDTIYQASTLAKVIEITDEVNGLDFVLDDETLSLATIRKIKWLDDDVGLDVRQLLASPPRTPEEIESLRSYIRGDPNLSGRLVSDDETSTLVVIKLEEGYDQAVLYETLHGIADGYAGPEKIYPFGRQIMSEEAAIGIRHDARILGPIALALMAAAMLIFFGSLRLTLGPVLMVGISILWTMGGMHYLGVRLSMLSSSIPAVLIALGSSYMIHVVYSCGEAMKDCDPEDGIINGVIKMLPPIGLAAGTSMVGFTTLVVFKIMSIREFGICVAVGVGFSAFLALVVLPAIIMLQKGAITPGPRSFAPLDRMLNGLTAIAIKHKVLVLIAGLLLFAIAAAGIVRIKVGFAPAEIFPKDHRARKVVDLFVKQFHGPYSLNIMFTTKEPGGIKSPDVLRQIDDFQQFAEGLPRVRHAASIVDILKKMNRILNEDSPEHDSIPDSRELVAQSMLLHSLTRDPMQFENLVDYDMQKCKVVISTTAIDSAELEKIYNHLVAYCEKNLDDDLNVSFGGQSMIWMAQNNYIITGKILNIFVNTILIWIICAVAFRSVRLGLISIIPLSMATLLTFGMMGHMGIRLDTATAVLTGISVGVGVDFAIHFISRLRRELRRTTILDDAVGATMLGAGRAIIFDAISNILGFAAFLFSGFAPVRTLGLLVCFTMVSCVLLTLLFIPAVMALAPIPFRSFGEDTLFLNRRKEQAADEVEPGS